MQRRLESCCFSSESQIQCLEWQEEGGVGWPMAHYSPFRGLSELPLWVLRELISINASRLTEGSEGNSSYNSSEEGPSKGP